MNRYVLNELSWNAVPGQESQFRDAFLLFLDLLSAAQRRGEGVCAQPLWDQHSVGANFPIYNLLYTDNIWLDKESRIRAMNLLAHVNVEPEMSSFNGEVQVRSENVGQAPGIAYAHRKVRERQAVACLSLETSDQRGRLPVLYGEAEAEVHFVVDDVDVKTFFRDAIDLEDADEVVFECLAPSAFPDLCWAKGVWKGLGSFSRSFRDMRDDVCHHLSVLNDRGAGIFEECLSTTPHQISARLNAENGILASDENGHTKSNNEARKNRTREFEGKDHQFWWHSKIERHRDRIHFLYDQGGRRIVIGLFTEHCDP